MPSKHKTPLLGWHPPAELSAWVRAEAERRGISISALLNDLVAGAKALNDLTAALHAADEDE